MSDFIYHSQASGADLHDPKGTSVSSNVITFDNFPITPSSAPTSNYQVANKKYVDDQLSSEDFWDRVGTTLFPNTSNDSVNIGTGTLTAGIITDGTFSVSSGVITGATNTNWDASYTHISSDGSDHSFINQSVISGASPTFDGSNITNIDGQNIPFSQSGFSATNVNDAIEELLTQENLWNRSSTTLSPHYSNDSLDIGTGNFTANNIELNSGSILANSSASGVITLGGTGGSNNEKLTIDFETTSNAAIIGTSTDISNIRFDTLTLRIADNQIMGFGALNSPDAQIGWQLTGNDNLQIDTVCGATNGSGYITIVEQADRGNANRSPASVSTDPVLRIYSSDATQADDYIEFYHDQDDAIINWGNGDLYLAGGNVGIGTAEPISILNTQISARTTVFDANDADTWADINVVNPSDTLNTATGIRFVIDNDAILSNSGAGIAGIKTISGGNRYDLAFMTSNSGLAEAMRIDYSGNVGIGTTPGAKLDVNGDLRINNDIQDSAGITRITLVSGGNLKLRDDIGVSRLEINDGNIGIGRTDPTAYLHLKAGTSTAGDAPIKLTGGTLLGTPEVGAIEFTGNKFYITNVSTQRPIDRTSCVVTSTTTVSNTTNETTIYTCYLPANESIVGNHIHLGINGLISNATAADDITINIYLGGVQISSYSPALGLVSNSDWHVEAQITFRTIGATASVAEHTHTTISGNEVHTVSLQTIDTTVAHDIIVKVQWDNAKSGNTISIYQGAAHWSN